MKRKGFTLIELLVVISIIALLLSILMPSLGRARDMAKTLTCAANCKQIGTLISLYQADNDGAVPIMLNRYASGIVPAKRTYLSLAFRDYVNETKKMPKKYKTDRPWPHQGGLYESYCEEYLPDFFKCPYTRGKGPSIQEYVGTRDISGVTYAMYQQKGSSDNYSPWVWQYSKGPNSYVYNSWPLPEMTDRYPKYGVLVWHNAYDEGCTGWPVYFYDSFKDSPPVKWGKKHLKRAGAASFADATVLFCDQGEFTSVGAATQFEIYNYRSHRRGSGGGTNVIFGDTHVGWLSSSYIGWP